jgi:hypothetical protein
MRATTIGTPAKSRPAGKVARRVFVLFVVLIAIAALAAVVERAAAGPGGIPADVTGLASATHPSETTWYRSTSPAFTWDPVAASNSAIAGY